MAHRWLRSKNYTCHAVVMLSVLIEPRAESALVWDGSVVTLNKTTAANHGRLI